MMRNFIPVLFTALSLFAGCTQPVEAAPSAEPPTAVTSPVNYGDCNTAHDAPVGSDRIRACPDRDGDGVRGPERCGDVWPSDIADPGEPSTGCVPLFDPSKLEEGTAAWQAWMADPVGHSYNEADWLSPVDCNDRDAGINQYALDIPIDHIDQDCDGTDSPLMLYADADQDSFPLKPELSTGRWAPIACHGEINDDPACDINNRWIWAEPRSDNRFDCRDDDGSIHPDAEERPSDAPIDRNCDGVATCLADNDDDGLGNEADGTINSSDMSCDHSGMTKAWGDCNDSDPLVHLGAIEPLNGIDDNCDGRIDERQCQLTLFLDPIVGFEWGGWRANVLIGAVNREGLPVSAHIAIGPGGVPQPLLGYNLPGWSWSNDQYVDPSIGGDLSTGSSFGSQFVSITTDDDYLAEIVINGNYWISGGLNYWGVLKHLVDAGDALDDVPFRISGQLFTCSDVSLSGGSSVNLIWSIENNDLHIKLVRF